MADDYPELPAKERERAKRREKKRRPKMGISGRSVLTLAQIIWEKARKEKAAASKSKRKKRRKK